VKIALNANRDIVNNLLRRANQAVYLLKIFESIQKIVIVSQIQNAIQEAVRNLIIPAKTLLIHALVYMH
jgi:hypothetical protein